MSSLMRHDPPEKTKLFRTLDYKLIVISVALIIISAASFAIAPQASEKVVSTLFHLATDILIIPVIVLFGFYVGFVLYVIFGRYGNIRLGPGKPHFGTITWIFMFICAGVSSAILYWSLVEWTYYYTTPGLNMEPNSKEALSTSIGYAIFNWGIPQWSCYAFASLVMAYYYHKRKHSDLSIGGVLEAVTGCPAKGVAGYIVDLCFLIGTVGGLTMTMVVSTLTLAAGFSSATGVPNVFILHAAIILVVGSIFTISSYIGISNGLKRLANIVCYGVFVCCAILLFMGQTKFMLANMVSSIGFAVSNFIPLFTFTDPFGDGEFYKNWSLFYWFWTLAYTPAVGIFAARVSHGRTMRQLACGMLFGGIGCAWTIHCLFGGYSLGEYLVGAIDYPALVMNQGGDIAIIKLVSQMPLPSLAMTAFLFILLVFLASHVDAAAYTIAATSSKNLKQGQDPHPMLRLFWCIVVALLPLAMITSKVSLQTVKTAVILSAIPFLFFLAVMTYGFLKWLKEDYGNKSIAEIDQEAAELAGQEGLAINPDAVHH